MPRESRLKYFLACDLARQEGDGKGTFVGAYGGAILVKGSFPAMLPSLALVACFTTTTPSEHISLKVRLPGDQLIETKAELKAPRPDDTHTLITQFIPCGIQAPGEIVAEYTFGDGSVEVGRLAVIAYEEYEKRRWSGPGLIQKH